MDNLWEMETMPTDGETLKLAAKSLNYAINELDGAADSVNEACESLADCPEYDRVKSILNDMEEILSDLKSMQERWEKGEA